MKNLPAVTTLTDAQRRDLSDHRTAGLATSIPTAQAEGLIAELERSLEPITEERHAFALGATLAGSFAQTPPCPDIFLAGYKRTLMDYPAELGERAVEELSQESTFLPARAELKQKLDALVEERRRMIRRAQMHVERNRKAAEEAEHQRNRFIPDQSEIPQDLRRFAANDGAKRRFPSR